MAGNATTYNYQAHWDDFGKDYDACRANPSGFGCSTILKMAGVTSRSIGEGVVENIDASGVAVGYTILGPDNQPRVIMEPAEYAIFSKLPPAWKENYLSQPSWSLDVASSIQRVQTGDFSGAMDHYGYMLGEPSYWADLTLNMALALGGYVLKLAPAVTAEGRIGGEIFKDTNQTARPPSLANANEPTLISNRVTTKATSTKKVLPNGNMADAHAEIGVIQQAFTAGKTVGASMELRVSGKAVCGFCRGDIAAMANESGLSSLTIKELATGKTLYWRPGMKSVKEVK
ncbi:hypothetical protein PS655_06019 [Pseudomonas fluorescens]|uniref:Putative cytidine deaminase C-terminal domain-containing protein n=1 Tax=Pseudomonas fluorescens TaxID=294 RepID=A0A5E6Y4A1_PSEFL|nr:hypothetical protein PS655_06019 [Pseudomonas fluorescens]